jgi:hypothetical protein
LIIHKISAPVAYYSDKTPDENTLARIPMEPIPVRRIPKEAERLKKQYGKIDQDILSFCGEWITHNKELLERVLDIVADDVEIELKKRNFDPNTLDTKFKI